MSKIFFHAAALAALLAACAPKGTVTGGTELPTEGSVGEPCGSPFEDDHRPLSPEGEGLGCMCGLFTNGLTVTCREGQCDRNPKVGTGYCH